MSIASYNKKNQHVLMTFVYKILGGFQRMRDLNDELLVYLTFIVDVQTI